MRGWKIVLFGLFFIQDGLFFVVSGSVSTSSKFKFFKNAFSGPHVPFRQDLDKVESGQSAIQCGVKCRIQALRYNNGTPCIGFVYSSTTGACLVRDHVAELRQLYHNGYGDLYMGSDCDLDKGYRFYYLSSGSPVCLLFILSEKNYKDAAAECRKKQGYLASAKTNEKIQLLAEAAFGHRVWVGASGAAKEGMFVWEEDGSAIPPDQYRNLFIHGRPLGLSPGSTHCLSIVSESASGSFSWGLFNSKCYHEHFRFICEMQLVV